VERQFRRVKAGPSSSHAMASHPLHDRCGDVAACAETLLSISIIRSRLAALAGLASFPEIWVARLAALAFLHDFGKTNLGFQKREAGHIREAAFIACDTARRRDGLDALDGFGPPTDFLLAVASAHHGEPPDLSNPGQDDAKWRPDAERDPLAAVKSLVALAKTRWPDAFIPILPLPDPESPFWHAFSRALATSRLARLR
jgi:CRISPR-associated endonuclease/helicase Cas3